MTIEVLNGVDHKKTIRATVYKTLLGEVLVLRRTGKVLTFRTVYSAYVSSPYPKWWHLFYESLLCFGFGKTYAKICWFISSSNKCIPENIAVPFKSEETVHPSTTINQATDLWTLHFPTTGNITWATTGWDSTSSWRGCYFVVTWTESLHQVVGWVLVSGYNPPPRETVEVSQLHSQPSC